jgi:hypothetical protein
VRRVTEISDMDIADEVKRELAEVALVLAQLAEALERNRSITPSVHPRRQSDR